MDQADLEFGPEIKKQIVMAIKDILCAGGFGELIVVFRKGNPEFVNHKIIKRFNQPREDESKTSR